MTRVELADRRHLYQGFGDALALAVELVATPGLFALGGHYLDRWAGTAPAFTIALTVLALVGMIARVWYGYDDAMRRQESSGPWARREAVPMTWPKPVPAPEPGAPTASSGTAS